MLKSPLQSEFTSVYRNPKHVSRFIWFLSTLSALSKSRSCIDNLVKIITLEFQKCLLTSFLVACWQDSLQLMQEVVVQLIPHGFQSFHEMLVSSSLTKNTLLTHTSRREKTVVTTAAVAGSFLTAYFVFQAELDAKALWNTSPVPVRATCHSFCV